MSETRKLEPCPFGCGDTAIRCENRTGVQMHWVMCNACHASPGDRRSEVEAIAAWNRRSHPATGRPTREGWVLVPREPTEEMANAARYHWGPVFENDDGSPCRAGRYDDGESDARNRAVWDQMLAAAPSPPPGDPE